VTTVKGQKETTKKSVGKKIEEWVKIACYYFKEGKKKKSVGKKI
jgi:hypothetical protein